MASIYMSSNGNTLAFIDFATQTYVVQLVGNVSQKSYREAFKAILKQTEDYPWSNILINAKDLQNIPDLGRQWLTTQFIPRFYRKIKSVKLALLSPTHALEKKGVSLFYGLVAKLGLGVQVKFFEELQEAQEWLMGEKEKAEKHFKQPSKGVLKPLQRLKAKASEKTKVGPTEVNLLKKSKFKVQFHFDPKGKIENKKDKLPGLPFLKLQKNRFKLKFKP